MQYTFSWGSFFLGIVILIISACVVVWHQKLADNLGDGVSDYGRYQMWGLIGCGIGLLVMTSIHTMIMRAVLGLFFNF